MQITLQDGRSFQGTASQIVGAMRNIAFHMREAPIGKYIDWVISNTERFEGIRLNVRGTSEEERAASLLDAMLEAGLAKRT